MRKTKEKTKEKGEIIQFVEGALPAPALTPPTRTFTFVNGRLLGDDGVWVDPLAVPPPLTSAYTQLLASVCAIRTANAGRTDAIAVVSGQTKVSTVHQLRWILDFLRIPHAPGTDGGWRIHDKDVHDLEVGVDFLDVVAQNGMRAKAEAQERERKDAETARKGEWHWAPEFRVALGRWHRKSMMSRAAQRVVGRAVENRDDASKELFRAAVVGVRSRYDELHKQLLDWGFMLPQWFTLCDRMWTHPMPMPAAHLYVWRYLSNNASSEGELDRCASPAAARALALTSVAAMCVGGPSWEAELAFRCGSEGMVALEDNAFGKEVRKQIAAQGDSGMFVMHKSAPIVLLRDAPPKDMVGAFVDAALIKLGIVARAFSRKDIDALRSKVADGALDGIGDRIVAQIPKDVLAKEVQMQAELVEELARYGEERWVRHVVLYMRDAEQEMFFDEAIADVLIQARVDALLGSGLRDASKKTWDGVRESTVIVENTIAEVKTELRAASNVSAVSFYTREAQTKLIRWYKERAAVRNLGTLRRKRLLERAKVLGLGEVRTGKDMSTLWPCMLVIKIPVGRPLLPPLQGLFRTLVLNTPCDDLPREAYVFLARRAMLLDAYGRAGHAAPADCSRDDFLAMFLLKRHMPLSRTTLGGLVQNVREARSTGDIFAGLSLLSRMHITSYLDMPSLKTIAGASDSMAIAAVVWKAEYATAWAKRLRASRALTCARCGDPAAKDCPDKVCGRCCRGCSRHCSRRNHNIGFTFADMVQLGNGHMIPHQFLQAFMGFGLGGYVDEFYDDDEFDEYDYGYGDYGDEEEDDEEPQ